MQQWKRVHSDERTKSYQLNLCCVQQQKFKNLQFITWLPPNSRQTVHDQPVSVVEHLVAEEPNMSCRSQNTSRRRLMILVNV